MNGVECHHLAFRAAKVDWQIWVQTGDKPLPMKYVITTKWMTAAPEFSVLLRDWDTQPRIPAGRFDFTPPAGAKRIESLRLNETGEVEIGEETTMNARKSLRRTLLVAGLLGASLIVDAEARAASAGERPGRPVAGVARRTTRRCIRRTTIFVATLPPTCTTVVVEGTSLHQCGGTYYQSSGSQYVVVNVD